MPNNVTWLSIPEVADLLGLRLRDVRKLVADHRLAAAQLEENGSLLIPREFLVGEEVIAPLNSLRGTLTLLADAGFNDAEAIAWLLNTEEELGESPLEALKSGRIHSVRRVAQMLAF